MAMIHWSKSHETGILSIDAQHRKLLELLNRVHEIMVENRDRSGLVEEFDVLAFLVDWLQDHIKGVDRSFGDFLNE